MKRNQSGFTLIEIAIVLVIIGLLLGGVLKGQELINSAKVKNLASDFKNVPIFIYGYQDKFRYLPGDDPNAASHVNNATSCAPDAANHCVKGNGLIDGAWSASGVADESYVFWQHVRLAGLLTGSTDTTSPDYPQLNTNGGHIGVQSNLNFKTITLDSKGIASLITGTYIVCSDGILGKYVKHLDSTLDNGNVDTGSMRVADADTGKSMANDKIDDAQVYTVCMGI
jgi:prepilin-type N-terminal cleavage/methylation domain-containing protein